MADRPTAYKLSVYISSALTIVLATFIFISYNYNRNLLRESIESNAIGLSSEILLNVKSHIVAVQEISINIADQMPFYIENKAINKIMDGVMEKYPYINAIHVQLYENDLEPNDKFYTALNENIRNVSKSEIDSLTRLEINRFLPKKDGNIVSGWTEPYICPISNSKVISFISPIVIMNDGVQENLIGIVSIDLSLDFLNNELNSINIGKRGFSLIASSKGTIIAHPNYNWVLNKNLLDLSTKVYSVSIDSVKTILANGMSASSIAYPESYNYEKCWINYTSIPDNHWMLVLVIPVAELYFDLRMMLVYLVLTSLLGLILVFFIVSYISTRLLTPLAKLSAEFHNFSVGKISTQGLNEIDTLSKSLNQLRKRYEKYKINEQKALINDKKYKIDLEQASEIQQSIIPTRFPAFPERKEIDIYAAYKPAFTISGDLYDYFFIDDRHLLITIGDVSGKGIPAALFMGVAHTLLRNNYSSMVAKHIVHDLNVELCEKNQNQFFVTLFLAILDVETGILNYCNAAHTKTKILRSSGLIEELDDSHGLPPGLYPERNYKDAVTKLGFNDILIMYTDGVTDAIDSDQGIFGENRLMINLQDMENTAPVDIVDKLAKSVNFFRGNTKQNDDYSIVVLKYMPD